MFLFRPPAASAAAPYPLPPDHRRDRPRWRRGLGAATLALAILLLSPAAHAGFAVSAIEFYDPDPEPDSALTDQDIKQGYFNRANCECGKSIRLRLRITIDRQSPDRFVVVVGSGTCLNTTDGSILTDTCRILKEGRIGEQTKDIEITTQDDNVTVGTLMGSDCTVDQELNVYVFTGQDGNWTQLTTTTFTADGTAPTAPTADGDPAAGENLVRVAFKAGSTSQSDVRYQILCEEANTHTPGLASPPEAGYSVCTSPTTTTTSDAGADAGQEVLDGGTTADATTADATTADATTADATTADATSPAGDRGLLDASDDSSESIPGTISSLDPSFVCSDILSADGSTNVQGLKNETDYRFYVVAFDLHGNPSEAVLLGEGKPILAEDLWERYKRSGGKAQGGFCALDDENTRDTSSWMTLLGGLALLALFLGRRRRTLRRQGGQR